MKTINVTWSDDDHTLDSNTVRWPEPITAASDSDAIARAVTEINGAAIISVDHDGEWVHVTVSA